MVRGPIHESYFPYNNSREKVLIYLFEVPISLKVIDLSLLIPKFYT